MLASPPPTSRASPGVSTRHGPASSPLPWHGLSSLAQVASSIRLTGTFLWCSFEGLGAGAWGHGRNAASHLAWFP